MYIEKESEVNLEKAKKQLTLFLENNSNENDARIAWKRLADICLKMKDYITHINALIELSKLDSVSFIEISNTANTLNRLLKEKRIGEESREKFQLVKPLLEVLEKRKSEANSDDFSRMAWLALNIKQETKTREYVEEGLKYEPRNHNLLNLKDRLNNN